MYDIKWLGEYFLHVNYKAVGPIDVQSSVDRQLKNRVNV